MAATTVVTPDKVAAARLPSRPMVRISEPEGSRPGGFQIQRVFFTGHGDQFWQKFPDLALQGIEMVPTGQGCNPDPEMAADLEGLGADRTRRT